ncbi:MAG: hypothetical protein ACKO25_09715 [Cyanobium sp.]
MTLDARSRERLEALGRRLPQALPVPQQVTPPAAAGGGGTPRLHPLETEQDPEQLFRELMAASPDGTVPPHLMERLRELEQTAAAPTRRHAAAKPQQRAAASSPGSSFSAEEQQQYATFAHLLLEDEVAD